MSDRDIDGLSLEDSVTLNRFVEIAEEKSRGVGILEEPTDEIGRASCRERV